MHTLFRFFLITGLLFSNAIANADTKTETKYDKLFVFGDSYSDIGAKFVAVNGYTPPYYLAKKIGIELTYPKAPNAAGKSLDYAASGASTGTDPGVERWCCQGIMKQVTTFAAQVKANEIQFNPDTTLFFIEGGLNDDELSAKQSIQNISEAVGLLKKLGGKHFTLTLLPTQVPEYSVVALRINPELIKLVSQEKKSTDIILNHWGAYLDEIKQNPARYGLVNVDTKCAGTKVFEQEPTVCATPDKYFFYFSRHPSAAVNKLVADRLYDELILRNTKN
jgi:phospholipase/lecithinase/hemolysin